VLQNPEGTIAVRLTTSKIQPQAKPSLKGEKMHEEDQMGVPDRGKETLKPGQGSWESATSAEHQEVRRASDQGFRIKCRR